MRRGWQRWTATAAALVALLLLLAATLDPAPFRGLVERRLSAALGRPVRVSRLAREGGASLVPRLVLEGVTVAQPAWIASGAPPMARLDRVAFRLPLLPLLLGEVDIRAPIVEHGAVLLLRTRGARANWKFAGAGGGATLAGVTIHDLRVRLVDQRRGRTAALTIAADPVAGTTVAGNGTIRGRPVAIAARLRPDGAFAGRVHGPTIDARAWGRTDRPGVLGAFGGRVVARGDDLETLDALAEAGLPGTQPFALAMAVRHDPEGWRLAGIRGTIGRSRLTGDATIRKRDGRAFVDARIHATALDFDDLASDRGRARAATGEARVGPRLVPATRIALDHLQDTDGRLDFRADRLLWRRPTPFRAARGRFALDRGVLRLSDVVVALPAGTVRGGAVIRQQGLGATTLALDLRVAGARLEDFAGHGKVLSPLAARIRLVGKGRTVRAAVANGRGKAAFVARGGTISRTEAEYLAGNVTRALKAGKAARVPLRCIVADFRGAAGRLAARPLTVDTAVGRADGTGTLSLADERLALTLPGASKVAAAFRLSGPLIVGGTLSLPTIRPARRAISAGGILKTIGRALGGARTPAARDADCGALAAAALR